MSTNLPGTHDDRVLTYTRGLSLFITPFLLVAFVLLYLFPGDTRQLFAWTIKPTMTPMVLASAYLGGSYFFLRVLRAQSWNAVKTGFLAVALFAALLGIATIIHWDKFNHAHVAFWLWAGLYFTAPFLVFGGWLANRRFAAPADSAEPRLGRVARWAARTRTGHRHVLGAFPDPHDLAMAAHGADVSCAWSDLLSWQRGCSGLGRPTVDNG